MYDKAISISLPYMRVTWLGVHPWVHSVASEISNLFYDGRPFVQPIYCGHTSSLGRKLASCLTSGQSGTFLTLENCWRTSLVEPVNLIELKKNILHSNRTL